MIPKNPKKNVVDLTNSGNFGKKLSYKSNIYIYWEVSYLLIDRLIV
jgi:hypothetical protein